MAVDPRFGNSSGYFKDPTNGQDFSVDTPRIVPCELKDGKFVWPRVATSDGSELLKIVFKLFTDEEKALYNQYRGRSPSTERKPRQVKQVDKVDKIDKIDETADLPNVEEQVLKEEPELKVIKFDPESVPSQKDKEIIAKCNRVIGASFICGIHYALLTDNPENKNYVYHVPRQLIPDSDWERLNGGF